MGNEKVVRIGGASAFLGDTSVSTPQLVKGGNVDYIIYDFLAEVTMMILTRVEVKRPGMGYARYFIEGPMRDNLRDIAEKKIKVISNAGGVSPEACREALLEVARDIGVDIKVAVVDGDNLIGRLDEFNQKKITEMYSGEPWPDNMMSIHAYLGAFPIAKALDMGADVVITGRIVDSALTLGPLIHEFGWKPEDFDLLAMGSLAGHVNECGAQATGGLHTDWEKVPDWANIGYPVLECHADGTFIVTKPEGTGGLVTRATVGEQMLYELGDPQAYLLPDVVCDFSQVKIEDIGKDRVKVSGAKGLPPTDTYKVCAGYHDGYRAVGVLPVIGIDAARKAVRQANAVIERTGRIFKEKGLEDYRSVWIEPLGSEFGYGAHSRARDVREVVCRIVVEHTQKEALDIFGREVFAPTTSMSPGTTGWHEGRPSVAPVVRLFSFVIRKNEVDVNVTMGEMSGPVEIRTEGGFDTDSIVRPQILETAAVEGDTMTVPLIRLAWGRSGDKGDSFNIGIIARKPEYMPYIRRALTVEAVRDYMKHVFIRAKNPRVERFDLPGICALNFLLHESLGGGGSASMRLDTLAKGMAQQLLDYPIPVPKQLLEEA